MNPEFRIQKTESGIQKTEDRRREAEFFATDQTGWARRRQGYGGQAQMETDDRAGFRTQNTEFFATDRTGWAFCLSAQQADGARRKADRGTRKAKGSERRKAERARARASSVFGVGRRRGTLSTVRLTVLRRTGGVPPSPRLRRQVGPWRGYVEPKARTTRRSSLQGTGRRGQRARIPSGGDRDDRRYLKRGSHFFTTPN